MIRYIDVTLTMQVESLVRQYTPEGREKPFSDQGASVEFLGSPSESEKFAVTCLASPTTNKKVRHLVGLFRL